MKKKRKRKHLVQMTLLCFVCLFLCACTTIDGDVPGKKEVSKYVKESVSEKYELESVEKIQEHPDKVEYTYSSKKRDLIFHAYSYLANITIDACSTSFYSREISCDYVSIMQELYYDDAEKILKNAECYDKEDEVFMIHDFDDVADIAKTIIQADRIYSKELEYNDKAFLKENPLMDLVIWRTDPLDEESWIYVGRENLTGTREYSEVYGSITKKYAQLCCDNHITDKKIPEKYTRDLHVSTLNTIMLNGKEMLYDINDTPYSTYGLTTDSVRKSWYNKQFDSYMLVCDIGLMPENGSGFMVINEYVTALGGTYHLDTEKMITKWKIGTDRYEMRAKYSKKDDEDSVISLDIKKNGEKLDIRYLTYKEDREVGISFGVGIPVEDFVKLFDLDYKIDEENETLIFESKE
ncbi:MAG: hypothetical protein EOM40_02530 [Clostridia bacterium]|nr:hypothetical protein [Clostridia bacterium]NCC43135.1 hypothetical protein [Clostridia bacterium]